MHALHSSLDLVRERSPEHPVALVRPDAVAAAAHWFKDNFKGEALYALHNAGQVPTQDPLYARGVEWLLRNQLSDGSWFMPTRAVPVQPHTFESGFPHGWHQFASDSASSWAAMALLFTLADVPPAKAESTTSSKRRN